MKESKVKRMLGNSSWNGGHTFSSLIRATNGSAFYLCSIHKALSNQRGCLIYAANTRPRAHGPTCTCPRTHRRKHRRRSHAAVYYFYHKKETRRYKPDPGRIFSPFLRTPAPESQVFVVLSLHRRPSTPPPLAFWAHLCLSHFPVDFFFLLLFVSSSSELLTVETQRLSLLHFIFFLNLLFRLHGVFKDKRLRWSNTGTVFLKFTSTWVLNTTGPI